MILGKGPTDRLDDTTTAAAKYSINFTEQQNKFCLSLHSNESNSFLFVNGVKIYQFKSKDSEINASPISLGNISKDFAIDKMKKPDYTHICMMFQLIVLMLMIPRIFINI